MLPQKAGRAIKPGQGASNLAPPLQPLPGASPPAGSDQAAQQETACYQAGGCSGLQGGEPRGGAGWHLHLGPSSRAQNTGLIVLSGNSIARFTFELNHALVIEVI